MTYHKLLETVSIVLGFTAFVISISTALPPLPPVAHANKPPKLTVNLLGRTYRPQYWVLADPKEEAYKNDRLKEFQKLLVKHGVTDPEAHKMFSAVLLTENGALAEDRDGDHGCSIGIPQRQVCQFGYSAKSFRKKYPEWKTASKQLDWAAEHMAYNLDHFKDLRKAVIAHNSPAAAVRGVDTKAHYYAKVLATSSTLTLQ